MTLPPPSVSDDAVEILRVWLDDSIMLSVSPSAFSALPEWGRALAEIGVRVAIAHSPTSQDQIDSSLLKIHAGFVEHWQEHLPQLRDKTVADLDGKKPGQLLDEIQDLKRRLEDMRIVCEAEKNTRKQLERELENLRREHARPNPT